MDLWYPKAKVWTPKVDKRRDGPGRPYSSPNTVDGAVCHSAVGYVGGLHDVLNNSARVAAWTFSSLYDGTIEQHYPLDAVLWNASNEYAHKHLIGIEHEGGYSPKNEPLRPAQLEASIELCLWISEQGDFEFSRTGTNKSLFEHTELAPSSHPTDCPSGRIPWDKYLAAVRKPDVKSGYDFVAPGENLYRFGLRHDMTPEEVAAMNGIVDPNKVGEWQLLRVVDNANTPAPPLLSYSAGVTKPDVSGIIMGAEQVQRIGADMESKARAIEAS